MFVLIFYEVSYKYFKIELFENYLNLLQNKDCEGKIVYVVH